MLYSQMIIKPNLDRTFPFTIKHINSLLNISSTEINVKKFWMIQKRTEG